VLLAVSGVGNFRVGAPLAGIFAVICFAVEPVTYCLQTIGASRPAVALADWLEHPESAAAVSSEAATREMILRKRMTFLFRICL
jgi:hypothetical protein